MKTLYFVVTLSSLLACGNFQSIQPAPLDESKPQVNVIVYDISTSTDEFAILTANHLGLLYDSIGLHGGGVVYGVHIMTNSKEQDVVKYGVEEVRLLPLQGNAYQQANRKKANQLEMQKFSKGKEEFIRILSSKLIVPKDHGHSDVRGAFELAKSTLTNPAWHGYLKNLIVLSDCEHTQRHAFRTPLTAIAFPDDVNISLVRVSPNVDLSTLITGGHISTFVTIEDAFITMVRSKSSIHE